MPYLKIKTNCELDKSAEQSLSMKASSTVSEQLGKPESYVMVETESGKSLVFAGSASPAVYMELKSIGLPENRTAELSAALCDLIGNELSVNTDRIYIEFANAERHLWGWDSRTF